MKLVLTQVCKFYCSAQACLFAKNAPGIIIFVSRSWEKHLWKCSLIKDTCFWCDKVVMIYYVPLVFWEISNNSAPIKKIILHFDQNQFMCKTLRKVVMTWSRLKNKFNGRHRKMIGVTIRNKEGFNTLCKAKREYFSNLDIKNESVNKMFWKAINPFFLDRIWNLRLSCSMKKQNSLWWQREFKHHEKLFYGNN